MLYKRNILWIIFYLTRTEIFVWVPRFRTRASDDCLSAEEQRTLQTAWVWTPALLLGSCVNLGRNLVIVTTRCCKSFNPYTDPVFRFYHYIHFRNEGTDTVFKCFVQGDPLLLGEPGFKPQQSGWTPCFEPFCRSCHCFLVCDLMWQHHLHHRIVVKKKWVKSHRTLNSACHIGSVQYMLAIAVLTPLSQHSPLIACPCQY